MKEVVSVTVGENLFGETYRTKSETTYTYYIGRSGYKNIYGELYSAETISKTEGQDIWGSTYTTTSTGW